MTHAELDRSHRYSERLPKTWSTSVLARAPSHRNSSTRTSESEKEEPVAPEEETPCSEALTKSYSLLFGLGQLTDELCGLHAIVKNRPAEKRFRPYALQSVQRFAIAYLKPSRGLQLREALAMLRGEDYAPTRTNVWARVAAVEKWVRSDRSLCERLSAVSEHSG